ncbi:MAG: ABC transporter ATP-binding protein [Ruminococcaceae bacterium]|nr:ABC transporter ATP-binding protein [Oscillospiraceae bacterium]
MKYILHYIRPYLGRMSGGLVIKFIGTITDLLLPFILAHIIDEVVPAKDVPKIVFWGAAMIVCSVICMAGNVIANRMASAVARDASRALRHDLFSRIMYLSCRQVDAFTIPSLESRLTTDTYNVHHMLGMMQRLGVRAPILLIGGIMVTAYMEPVLTLVMVAVLPFITVVVWKISAKGIPLYTQMQLAVDNMVRVVRENIQGVRVIKALSKTDYERRRYEAVNEALVKSETKAGVTMAATNPLMTIFLNTGLTAVLFVGAFRVNAGISEPGKIMAFISYFTLISNAMMSITRMFVMYSKGTASANRIGEVLDIPLDLDGEDLPVRSDEDYLVFDHVTFSYNGTRDNVRDISFSVPVGGTLGIIGATGAGKTTLLALLLRFYDVNSGAVRIGGKDIRSMEAGELREKFGTALQNDFIYEDTVAENIRIGRDIPMDALRRAAENAQALDFIDAFEDGFDHMLTTKGTNVSGGQRQRILIARALAGHPEILLLDDASSALDYKTDANLRRALRENCADTKATILVAQRISAVMHCDHILVIDEGEIIGAGTHEELLDTCEIYREIADSQLGGAFE